MPWLSNENLATLANAVLMVDVIVLAWPEIERWANNEWIGGRDFTWRRYRSGRRVRR